MDRIPIDQIAVETEIPELDVPFAEIRSPRYGYPVEFMIVCPKLVQVWTHYYRGRTQPHLKDRALCEGCQLERPKRWKGYLGAWDPALRRYILAEVTQYAAIPYKKLFDSEKCDLRGARAKLTRLGKSPNSRCKLDLWLNQQPVDQMPEPFPVLQVLKRIWEGDTSAGKKERNGGIALGDSVPE